MADDTLQFIIAFKNEATAALQDLQAQLQQVASAAGTKTRKDAVQSVKFGLTHSSSELARLMKSGGHPDLVSRTFFLALADAEELDKALLSTNPAIKG